MVESQAAEMAGRRRGPARRAGRQEGSPGLLRTDAGPRAMTGTMAEGAAWAMASRCSAAQNGGDRSGPNRDFLLLVQRD